MQNGINITTLYTTGQKTMCCLKHRKSLIKILLFPLLTHSHLDYSNMPPSMIVTNIDQYIGLFLYRGGIQKEANVLVYIKHTLHLNINVLIDWLIDCLIDWLAITNMKSCEKKLLILLHILIEEKMPTLWVWNLLKKRHLT